MLPATSVTIVEWTINKKTIPANDKIKLIVEDNHSERTAVSTAALDRGMGRKGRGSLSWPPVYPVALDRGMGRKGRGSLSWPPRVPSGADVLLVAVVPSSPTGQKSYGAPVPSSLVLVQRLPRLIILVSWLRRQPDIYIIYPRSHCPSHASSEFRWESKFAAILLYPS